MRHQLRTGRWPLNLARTAALAAVASLPLAALPATAVAAEENSPPSRPLKTELSTGLLAGCVSGPELPYVGQVPELAAVIRDPDASVRAEQVTARFEVFWKDSGGHVRRKSLEDTATVLSRGTTFRVTPSDVPTGTVIGWRVRAHDGTEWGPWSSSGGQGPCAFVHDDQHPEAATVSSAEYPDDASWYDGVGSFGTFTFDSPSKDTAEYRYSFNGQVTRTVRPESLGGPAALRWAPEDEGRFQIEVQAVDRAGNPSTSTGYDFLVAEGRAPTAHWRLADAAGSGAAAAEAGSPATAGAGVVFGAPGPSGTDVTAAAQLDGTADAYLTPGSSAVDTTKPFAVSGWVRPASLDRDMTAVSQDAGAGGAASLGLRTDGGAAIWSLALPTATGTVRVEGGTPAAGRWTHLAGVYDPVAHTAELFVDGVSAGKAEAVTALATGTLQVGRLGGADGHTGNWRGMLADVRVWDRLVFEGAFTDLAHREATRTGYWQLNESGDGRSSEYAGGQDLLLGGDAQVPPPNCAPDDIFCTPEALVGTSSLRLDGVGDHAATEQPVIDSDGSFTLAARVRFDSDPTRDMAVLSLPGAHANALVLRYSADTYSWELAVTETDAAGAAVTTVESWSHHPTRGAGDHLTVTYDASSGTLTLYVNAEKAVNATVQADLWSSTGGLQLGRSLTPDGWGEHLHGAVDEVRSYTGVLTDTEISRIRQPAESPDL